MREEQSFEKYHPRVRQDPRKETNMNVQAMQQWLRDEAVKRDDETVRWTAEMVRIPSEVPLSDTRAIADYARDVISGFDGMVVSEHTLEEPVRNIVGVCKGLKTPGPGGPKRLIFNGHLDTYPVGDLSQWDDDPFSGLIKDGRIYGRGSCDMKGGIAAAMTAVKLLSERRDLWSGEVVLALGGDEENMGERGTKYLLDTVPEAVGDAMICPDVGVANVLRFGQKGMYWISLEAEGKPGHGAHVHKGVNAIDRLVEGITRINREVGGLPVNAPEMVTRAILDSAHISEPIAGKGETEVLQKVTVNFGQIGGGLTPNLIPASAWAKADIRIPVGVSLETVAAKVKEIVDSIEGLSYTAMRAYAPNYSDPDHEIFDILKRVVSDVLHKETVNTMRVGASDARLYRIFKNVPSVNCGLTPFGLGGPNEYTDIKEMIDLSAIHALAAYEFLSE